MNNTSCHYEPITPDDQPDEFDALLREALAAPPVPMSLLRRLDQAIETQWGASPGLVNEPVKEVVAAVVNGASYVRLWPLAASLAAILLFAIVFLGGSKSYAWSTVLDAIARERRVQMGPGDAGRQLSLADSATTSESERTRRLVAFLLSETQLRHDWDSLAGIRVTGESWTRQDDAIALRVQFETAAADRFDLNLLLDPQTSLPRVVTVVDQQLVSQPLPLTYPSVAVVTADRGDSPAGASATGVAAEHPDRTSIAAESTAPESPTVAVIEQSGTMAEAATAAFASLPLGAATQWRSVALRQRTDAEVVAQIDEVLAELWTDKSVLPVSAASDQRCSDASTSI